MGTTADRDTDSSSSSSKSGRKALVYGLSGPDLVVRYWGVTTSSLPRRMAGHVFEARNEVGTHKRHWMRKLLDSGVRPKICLVLECDSLEDAYQTEILLIALGRCCGGVTNSTDGGEGVHDVSGEVARKIGAAHRGKVVSPAARRKMSEARKGRPIDLEQRRQQRTAIDDKGELIVATEYDAGHSVRQIAISHGWSTSVVEDALSRMDIRRRTRSQALRIVTQNKDYRSRQRENSRAYFATLSEGERLRKFTRKESLNPELYKTIQTTATSNPDWSFRKIARAAGTNHHLVARVLRSKNPLVVESLLGKI